MLANWTTVTLNKIAICKFGMPTRFENSWELGGRTLTFRHGSDQSTFPMLSNNSMTIPVINIMTPTFNTGCRFRLHSIWLSVQTWIRVDSNVCARPRHVLHTHHCPLHWGPWQTIRSGRFPSLSHKYALADDLVPVRAYVPPPASAESTAGCGADKGLVALESTSPTSSALILRCPQPVASGAQPPAFPCAVLFGFFARTCRSVHAHVDDDALAVAAGVGSKIFRASMEAVPHSWPNRRWERKSLKIRALARQADGSVVICQLM